MEDFKLYSPTWELRGIFLHGECEGKEKKGARKAYYISLLVSQWWTNHVGLFAYKYQK